MAVVIDTEGPASSVMSGDDVVTVETLVNGTVDAIKLELELLSAVGEVSLVFIHQSSLPVIFLFSSNLLVPYSGPGVSHWGILIPRAPLLLPAALSFGFQAKRVQHVRLSTATTKLSLAEYFCIAVGADLRTPFVIFKENVLSVTKCPHYVRHDVSFHCRYIIGGASWLWQKLCHFSRKLHSEYRN